MQRLGEILIEKGVLSLTELHTALETCHRTGSRLGTQLLEFGYVDESMLLDALSKQLRCPNVPKVKLLHSPLEIRKALPVHVGRRLLAVPFAETDTGFRVAMTNPNDRVAIDEIATHLRKTVVPHVATEAAVRAALGAAEADDADWAPDAETPEVVRGNGDLVSWNRLWEPSRLRPAAILAAPTPRPHDQVVLMATYPDLSPVGAGRGALFEPEIDDDSFSELLHRADHRDGIGSILVRYAASLYDRVCLFAVHKRAVNGWMARGRSVVIEDLQSLSLSLDASSIFADVGHADSYVGAVLSSRANDELIGALAEPAPAEVVLVPVRVKQRVVAYLLCDDPGHPASQEPLERLVTACRKAGVAFEALLLRRKILS